QIVTRAAFENRSPVGPIVTTLKPGDRLLNQRESAVRKMRSKFLVYAPSKWFDLLPSERKRLWPALTKLSEELLLRKGVALSAIGLSRNRRWRRLRRFFYRRLCPFQRRLRATHGGGVTARRGFPLDWDRRRNEAPQPRRRWRWCGNRFPHRRERKRFRR